MNAPMNEMHIIGVGGGFATSKILLTAVELGVFSALAEKAMTGEELGAVLGLHPRAIWDFFDSLAALGFLDREGDGRQARYRNTDATGYYLDKAKPSYIGGLLEMWNDRAYRFWSRLGVALKTGQPQNEISSTEDSMFEAVYADEARVRQFADSMSALSQKNFEALAKKFDFSKHRTLCDLGGASGLLTRVVAGRHEHLRCVTFDLPQVEQIARNAVEKDGLWDRIKVVSGDFFHDRLPEADVITMGMILHNWNLQKKQQLISRVYEALPEGGVFIAIETLIDDARRENVAGLINSLQMLLDFGDAFDYTGADFAGWCKQAGFKSTEVVHLAGASSAAIAYK